MIYFKSVWNSLFIYTLQFFPLMPDYFGQWYYHSTQRGLTWTCIVARIMLSLSIKFLLNLIVGIIMMMVPGTRKLLNSPWDPMEISSAVTLLGDYFLSECVAVCCRGGNLGEHSSLACRFTVRVQHTATHWNPGFDCRVYIVSQDHIDSPGQGTFCNCVFAIF